MASLDADLSPARAAALHAGLGHPVRVAAMRILRRHGALPLRELRKRVAEAHRELDTRTMQHHAYKMQLAGLVDVALVEGEEVVRLIQDVTLRIRPAAQ